MTTSASAPRTAVLVPYSLLWADVLDFDLAIEREAFATSVASALAGRAEIVSSMTLCSLEDGMAAGLAARSEQVDVVLVVQSMATQPAFTLAALDELAGVAIVVWWARGVRDIPVEFDHAAIVTEGGAVGTPMLTSVLLRRHLPFQLVEGVSDDDETLARVADALAIGCAASRLRRARIGRVGSPIAGYDCVDADEDRLVKSVVGEFVHIPPSEIRRRFQAVDDDCEARLGREVRSSYDVEDSLSLDSLSRTVRLALAVELLCEEERLDAGVMNCHVPEIRFDGDVGVTPCFALGRSTTGGVPWTCAGDLLTVIPMLALKLLGEGCVYHELEAYDSFTDEFVIANTGEHDLALAGTERPRLVRNEWFSRDRHCGACLCYSLRPGPAAIVGFTQIGEIHRFIVAEGEITGRSWPTVGTVNGAFRFAAGPGAWARWCEGGVNHHSALTSAAAIPKLEQLCRLLGVEYLLV